MESLRTGQMSSRMMPRVARRLSLLLMLPLLVAVSSPAAAKKKRRGKSAATFSADYAKAPAYGYANLTRAACFKEVARRKLSIERVKEARGVNAPVRIKGRLGGVLFRTGVPRARGRKSPFEVFDCRLLLALHDFSAILSKHHIDEVIIYSAWRPPPKSWPAGKQARRHPGALAVDIDRMRQRIVEAPPAATDKAAPKPAESKPAKAPAKAKPKYRWLDVEKHFHGKIGSKTCGPKARGPKPAGPFADELHKIVCETAAARLFTSMLTPNYNKAHFNHFHFELTTAVKWRIVR